MATIYTVTNPSASSISRPKSSTIVDKNSQSSPQTLRVLIDMDNVLCDLEQGLLKAFRRTYPKEPYVPLDQRKGLNVRKQYSELRPDLGEKIHNIHCASGFLRDLPEVPGACDALKEMRKIKGVQIFIYSSPVTPYEHSLKEKCRWVEEHLGLEWLDKVIFLKDTTLLTGHVLIDDRISFKAIANIVRDFVYATLDKLPKRLHQISEMGAHCVLSLSQCKVQHEQEKIEQLVRWQLEASHP